MKNPSTVDGRTFAIGVLSITASILLVGFVLVAISPKSALAIGQNDRSGDYIMLTQQLTNTNEGVIVIDAAAKRMILYAYDYNDRKINVLSGLALDRLPRAGEGDQPAEHGGRKKP